MTEQSINPIWKACDNVRERMSSSEFNAAIASLFFLRWAEDCLDGSNASDESTGPVLPPQLSWTRLAMVDSHDELARLVSEISKSVDATDSKNLLLLEQYRAVLPGLQQLATLPGATLRNITQWLSQQPFETPGDKLLLRSVLDACILHARDKFSGQHVTPKTVLDAAVRLAAPQRDESVHDPCYGSGGFLTGVIDYEEQEGHYGRSSISGFELDPLNAVIGFVRVLLSGENEPFLYCRDSLKQAKHDTGTTPRFDVVLMNPPWGGKPARDIVERFPIPTRDISALFIQHALSQLKTGGRAVMVLPPGILFRGGPERQLRQLLVEEHTVEAVVGLPEGLFRPYTSIASTIVILRKGGSTCSIRMCDLSHLKKIESEVLAEQIVNLVRDSSFGSHSWNVDAETIRDLDYDLTPKRRSESKLVSTLESLPNEIQIQTLQDCCEIFAGRSAPTLNVRPSGSKYLTLEEAARLAGISASKLLSAREHGHIRGFADRGSWKFTTSAIDEYLSEHKLTPAAAEPGVPYVQVGDIKKGAVDSTGKVVRPDAVSTIGKSRILVAGDILVSKSGSLGKIALVTVAGGVAASGLYVLRVKDREVIDPYFLFAFLQSEDVRSWMDSYAQGSTAKHIPMKAVRSLPVPVPWPELQKTISLWHRQRQRDVLQHLVGLTTRETLDQIASAIDRWANDSNRQLVDATAGTSELPVGRVLHLLEEVARREWPIARCSVCGQPYFRDYDDPHTHPPYDWSKGIETTCLGCWLGVDPDHATPSHGTPELLDLSYDLPMWALRMQEATDVLQTISRIPDAGGVLNVLQSAQEMIQEAAQKLDQSKYEAQQFSANVLQLIDSYSQQVSKVDLQVNVDRVVRHGSGEISVVLKITNRGLLALRDVQFEMDPPLPGSGTALFSYMPPDKEIRVEFSGHTKPDEQDSLKDERLIFRLIWQGRQLTGDRFVGDRSVAAKVASEVVVENSAVDAELLGGSPYVCGTPVKPERNDVFFGREELISQIERQILQSGNVVLLQGNRRAGKSSILWQLEGKDSVPGWLGVMFDLQECDGVKEGGIPAAQIFQDMAYVIAKAVRKLKGSVLLPDGSMLDANRRLGVKRAIKQGISEDGPFGDFREYIELILEELKDDGYSLLLMIDEFDKLQEGIDNGVTSPQVPENIRFLIQTYPNLSAILTGSRRLKRMREEYFSALFGLGTKIDVSSLSEAAASRLVTEPVSERLTYAKDAVELAYTLTARQPYLLQCLCNRVFDLAAQRGVTSITIDHVGDAAKALVEDNEHFSTLWDYTGTECRRFLLALIHREEHGPIALRVGVLQAKLEEHGVEMGEEVLLSDLEFLYELELVEFHREGSFYSITIPLMGQWIESQPEADFEALRMKARAEAADLDSAVDDGFPEGNDDDE